MYGRDVIDGLWPTTGIKVTRCGYLAPGELVPDDHSLLWMDVTYKSPFHQLPILLQTFQAWRLWLYDSKTVKRYLEMYYSLFAKLVQSEPLPRRKLSKLMLVTPYALWLCSQLNANEGN